MQTKWPYLEKRNFALCRTEGGPKYNFTFQRRNENLTIGMQHFDHHETDIPWTDVFLL